MLSSDIETIDEISVEANQLLLPYLKLFRTLTENYKEGTFFIDPMGVYVALDDGRYRIIHLERLPFERKSVYAITDLQDCAVYQEGLKTVFFRGVKRIENIGFKFIKEEYMIRPLLDLSFPPSMRMIK